MGNFRLVKGDQVIVTGWPRWKNETGPPKGSIRATIVEVYWVGVAVEVDGLRARVAHNLVKLVPPLQQLAEASNE